MVKKLTEEERKKKELEKAYIPGFQIPPPEEPAPEIPKKPAISQPEILREQDTGKITGVTLPSGETYFGTAEDVAAITRAHIPEPTPPGAIEATTAQRLREREQISEQAFQLFQKYKGKPLPPEVLSGLSKSDIDTYQALATGSFGALTGLAGGVVTGALAGGAIGALGGPAAPITVPIGAAVGATVGIITGVRSNVKSQIGGLISSRQIELREGEQNLRMIITDINSGGNPMQDVQAFYETLAGIQQSHARLHLDTQRDLSKFVGEDGTPELARYETFFAYTLPLLEGELQQAILNPNPNKILVEISEVENAM